MRAFTLESFDDEPALREDVPEPDVGDHEVLVRVHASSVNPVDVYIAAGALKDMAEHEFPGLEQAGEALQALPSTHTQGKLGLTIV